MKTKRELAKILNISERTIFRYHKIAIEAVPNFGHDYPYLTEMCTKVPLTDYQCWVISRLSEFSKVGGLYLLVYKDEDNLNAIRGNFREKFSKEAYRQYISENSNSIVNLSLIGA